MRKILAFLVFLGLASTGAHAFTLVELGRSCPGGYTLGEGSNADRFCCLKQKLTCANVRCKSGFHCVETAKGPDCVADSVSCNATSNGILIVGSVPGKYASASACLADPNYTKDMICKNILRNPGQFPGPKNYEYKIKFGDTLIGEGVCPVPGASSSAETCNPFGGAIVSLLGHKPDDATNCTSGLADIKSRLAAAYATNSFVKNGINQACPGKTPNLSTLVLKECNFRGNQGTEFKACVTCK